jgi:hypothetical protein
LADFENIWESLQGKWRAADFYAAVDAVLSGAVARHFLADVPAGGLIGRNKII